MPTAISSTPRSAAYPAIARCSSTASLISAITARIAIRRLAGRSTNASIAARIDVGLALYESLRMIAPDGARSICMRIVVRLTSASDAAPASRSPPTAPTHANAAAALIAMCRPLIDSRTSALPHGVSTTNDGRASSSSTTSRTCTSASAASPNRRHGARGQVAASSALDRRRR